MRAWNGGVKAEFQKKVYVKSIIFEKNNLVTKPETS